MEHQLSSENLAAILWRRARSLIDDPSTTLFFGRTDHADGERWYIGRRHVADDRGDPVIVDWRAEISWAFYRASRAQPLGVVRRRRFGVEGGTLTAYEDEHLDDSSDADSSETADRSAILAYEIERPRVGTGNPDPRNRHTLVDIGQGPGQVGTAHREVPEAGCEFLGVRSGPSSM